MVLAGLTDRSWRALRALYRLGARRDFDVAALNPFSSRVRDVVEIVARGRRVMELHGDARKPLLVTEMSWPSALGSVRMPLGYEETERGQARKLRTALLALARHRRGLGVRGVFWYTWLTADDNPFYSFAWSGLRRLEESTVVSKPAYHALRRVARRLRGARR